MNYKFSKIYKDITQNKLKKILKYNKKTGEFFWRANYTKKVFKGKKAGYVKSMNLLQTKDGVIKNYKYNYVRIGHELKLSVLAWIYVYGKIPEDYEKICYKDKNTLNDRIENLYLKNIQKLNIDSYVKIDRKIKRKSNIITFPNNTYAVTFHINKKRVYKKFEDFKEAKAWRDSYIKVLIKKDILKNIKGEDII